MWRKDRSSKYPFSLRILDQYDPDLRFHFSVNFGENTETSRYYTRIFVSSSGDRKTVLKKLFLKWLWDELTSEEMELFICLPETIGTPVIFACLQARARGIPKKLIRNRLNKIIVLNLLGEKITPFTRERYLSLKQVRITLKKIRIPARPLTRYSGYTKNYKDKGTLRNDVNYFTSKIFEEDVNEEKEIFILHLLTVGRLEILGREINLDYPDESKRTKR